MESCSFEEIMFLLIKLLFGTYIFSVNPSLKCPALCQVEMSCLGDIFSVLQVMNEVFEWGNHGFL